MASWDQGSVDLHQRQRAAIEGIYEVRFLAQGLRYSESHVRSMLEGRRDLPSGLVVGSLGRAGQRRLEVKFAGTQPPELRSWEISD